MPPKYRKLFRLFLWAFGLLFSLQKTVAQSIITVAGNGRNAAWGNGGPALQASVPYPTGVCVDSRGNLYLTTAETVRKVTAGTAIITPFAGSGQFGYSGDGATATEAAMKSPVAMCTDKGGNLFIAEYNGHRVRRVSPSGIITTVAGTGTPGFSGDGGAATKAQLYSPRSLATDAAGHLYIADFHNNRIRKVDVRTGTISTIAGNGMYMSTGDGGRAAAACIVAPTAICMDSLGNLFFTEADLNRSCRVRKIAAGSGTITTVAGNGSAGFGGDNGPAVQAMLFLPTGLAVNENGDLFIAEHNGSRIRKVDGATGVISTITGNGSSGFGGDGGPAAHALLSNPLGLALDTAGYLFVADNNNHRIRRLETKLPCTELRLTLTATSALFCYNAAPQFTTALSGSLINPVYQWRVNGDRYGGNQTAAIIPARIGDVISCEVSGKNACGENIKAVSNSITILSNPGYNKAPEITITADKERICAGTKVTFTATNKSESASPHYQWLVNGAPAGTNHRNFSTTTLVDGDKVECIMTVPHCGSNSGTTKGHSNAIILKVEPLPVIRFTPSNPVIKPGAQAELKTEVQGSVASHQWAPASLLTNPAVLSATTMPLTSTTPFQLRVKTAAGCEATASVTVTVYSKLYLPTAFTPNGDGKNDVFRIPPTTAFTLKEFTVFDRWGSVVFFTRDISKGWDGKKEGTSASADTYVYIIRGDDNNGALFLKGTVQLVR